MAYFELPQDPAHTTAQSAGILAKKITDELSILFIVIGSSEKAITLRGLAEAQTKTSGVWIREVVWITDTHILAEPELAAFIKGVDTADIGFTLGWLDKPAMIIEPTDVISTGAVFLAYAEAEAQS